MTEFDPVLADGDTTAVAVSCHIPLSLINETGRLAEVPLSVLTVGVLVVLRGGRDRELFNKVYSLISVRAGGISESICNLFLTSLENVVIGAGGSHIGGLVVLLFTCHKDLFFFTSEASVGVKLELDLVLHCSEELETESINVFGLLAENFPGKVVKHLREFTGNGKLLQVLGSHNLYLYQ